MMYFQDLVFTLQNYWSKQGCLLAQPYDIEKGAGTFNPATFLRSLGPEPFSAVYIEPCRRPADGRYGENPLRLQHYFQLQVILKPSPENIIDLYLGSLREIGILPEEHDIRFVHDDWETAALGAWGLGWEVWCDGTEVTQFTYFQQIGGIELTSIPGEITYGLERLCMFLQGVDNVFDLQYNKDLTYGDLYHQNEYQFSKYNFEKAPVSIYLDLFQQNVKFVKDLCEQELPIPALDYVIKASHSFNILDARNAISVRDRQDYIFVIKNLSQLVANAWLKHRQSLKFPLLKEILQDSKELQSTEVIEDPFQEGKTERGNFLLEVGVEELPAQVFDSLHQQLPLLWEKWISPLKLNETRPQFFSTPRRISILVEQIDLYQPIVKQEIKGPPLNVAKKDGQWTKVASEFSKKNNQTLDDIFIKKFGKFEYIVLNVQTEAKSALKLLSEQLPILLERIHWYKTMRWGKGTNSSFVRPVRWLVATLNQQVIPFEFCEVSSSNKTKGHRFLGSSSLEVSFENYEKVLEENFVLVNPLKRQKKLEAEIKHVITQKSDSLEKTNLSYIKNKALLKEVNQLIEYPFPLVGEFKEAFLKLPKEVLISEMKEHQKCFSVGLVSKKGKSIQKLAPYFVTVLNMKVSDEKKSITGFSNVLTSRFHDGAFFLEEDLKVGLQALSKPLAEMAFIGKLGSMLDKSKRLEKSSLAIAQKIGMSNSKQSLLKTAAGLCKNDLVSKMVFEFPDLQGVIGNHYAQKMGLEVQIGQAIEEHYLPKDATDRLPTYILGAVLGLADRLDTIVHLFLMNKKPTSSSDPYALRRICIACIHLLIEHKINLSLDELVAIATSNLAEGVTNNKEELEEIKIFFQQRFKYILTTNDRIDLAISPEWVQVVLKSPNWSLFYDSVTKVRQLKESEKSVEIIGAIIKRISNVSKNTVSSTIDEKLFQHESENKVYEILQNVKLHFEKQLLNKEYALALQTLTQLENPVSDLFDSVMITDSDLKIRENRFALLNEIRKTVTLLFDFSALP